MSDDNPDTDGPVPTQRGQEQHSVRDSGAQSPGAEAKRYARAAAERPAAVRGDERRLVELLRPGGPSEPLDARLERRTAASTALARVARDDSDGIRGYVGELVDELRREHTRELPADTEGPATVSRGITDTLAETIALVIAEQPETVGDIDDISEYTDAVTTELGTATLRTVTKAFCASASELQRPTPVVETLGALLAYPDSAVRAWGGAALGRLATEYPDEVATTADALRDLVGDDDGTVRHNAVEALGALVRERPDAVVPAADTLREHLTHDDVAIQHNAAGVLGHLAETHPDAVLPAADDLRELCTHEDEAVRRIATGALARLGRERPDAVAGDKPPG